MRTYTVGHINVYLPRRSERVEGWVVYLNDQIVDIEGKAVKQIRNDRPRVWKFRTEDQARRVMRALIDLDTANGVY